MSETAAEQRATLLRQRRFLILMSLGVIAFYTLGIEPKAEANVSGLGLKITQPDRLLIALWLLWGWSLWRYGQRVYELLSVLWGEVLDDVYAEDRRIALARAKKVGNKLAAEGHFEEDMPKAARVDGAVRIEPPDPDTLQSVIGEKVTHFRDFIVTREGGRHYPTLKANCQWQDGIKGGPHRSQVRDEAHAPRVGLVAVPRLAAFPASPSCIQRTHRSAGNRERRDHDMAVPSVLDVSTEAPPNDFQIASGDRRDNLRRARELLATGTAADLRYAALELRLCLEVMTYDKLHSFAKYLPRSFLERTWQPPQLLKAMKQLDANADQSILLHMGPPFVEGVKPADDEYRLVGEHKAFGQAWLRKHYNKLGNLLHLQLKAGQDETAQRSDLMNIADEIEEAQRGSILGIWFGEAINFPCEACGETSTVSAHYARTQGSATCLNPTCEAEYIATSEGDQILLTPLIVRINCKSCGAKITVQQRHLKQGLIASCPACNCEHGFRCRWEYGIASPPQGAPANE